MTLWPFLGKGNITTSYAWHNMKKTFSKSPMHGLSD